MKITDINTTDKEKKKYKVGLEKIGILQSKKVWKENIFINIELFELLKK